VSDGPYRIQQEGRIFDIGEKATSGTEQRSKGKGKTQEQKERDRLRKIEYRKENRGIIRAYNVAKHDARRPDIEARKSDKAEKARQRGLWDRYERACMEEIGMHRSSRAFPDWGYEWVKERAKRASALRYARMDQTQKQEYNQRCMGRNPAKRKADTATWKAQKRASDPVWRMTEGMRARLSRIVSGAGVGGSIGMIGCTALHLKQHLESQFKKWMTWENYGHRWHVDHIVPISKFDHTVAHQLKQCWHYTNLRPLCAKENMAKGNRTLVDTQLSLTL